jgi:hypothetical protein
MKYRLKTLTETTGGYTYFPTTLERCRETIRQIVQEVAL